MTNQLCTCGHEREAHEHFRRGHDCGVCGPEACPRFTPPSSLRALVARLRRHTPPHGRSPGRFRIV